MLELIFMLAVLLGMGVYDLRKMKMASLKREMLPYLALMLTAAAVAVYSFINQNGPSLSRILMNLFGIKE
jgi:hypothetical protein